MALQKFNNGELMSVFRTKLNSNADLTETNDNKIQVISATPSTTKYPSEKAVSDFTSKVYSATTIPVTKSGDLLLHLLGTGYGKIKHNDNGTLNEFVPDRSICRYQMNLRLSCKWNL